MNTIQTTAETGSYVLQEQEAATRKGSYCRKRKLLQEQEATVEKGSYSLHQQEATEGTVNYYVTGRVRVRVRACSSSHTHWRYNICKLRTIFESAERTKKDMHVHIVHSQTINNTHACKHTHIRMNASMHTHTHTYEYTY